MNTCPCCGHPTGDRSWAPRNGTAPCATDRHPWDDVDWLVAVQPLDAQTGVAELRPLFHARNGGYVARAVPTRIGGPL